MKNYFFYFLLSVSIVLTSGCSSEMIEKDHPKVLFEYEYVNRAWINNHIGWLLDSSGNLHYYDNPVNWIDPDAEGYISQDELSHNISKTQSTESISPKQLTVKHLLIDLVTDGPFTEPQCCAYDSGTLSLYCYKWDKEIQKNKRILIVRDGNIAFYNLNPAAKELKEWLFMIGSQTENFFWF